MLRAADDPAALLKALNAVGPMGYLKGVLGTPEIADLAAHVGRVRAAANPQGPVVYWPAAMDIGRLSDRAAPRRHRLRVHARLARATRPRRGLHRLAACPARSERCPHRRTGVVGRYRVGAAGRRTGGGQRALDRRRAGAPAARRDPALRCAAGGPGAAARVAAGQSGCGPGDAAGLYRVRRMPRWPRPCCAAQRTGTVVISHDADIEATRACHATFTSRDEHRTRSQHHSQRKQAHEFTRRPARSSAPR